MDLFPHIKCEYLRIILVFTMDKNAATNWNYHFRKRFLRE
jgi:hypothetical protein